MLNIAMNRDGDTLTVALEGRLDTRTAPELEHAIGDALEEISELIFDFGQLEYIASAGLRVLIASQKEMSKHGSMKLINVPEMVMEVLEVTGLADVLDIERIADE